AGAEPHLVLDLPDRLVVHKPPGWQVDSGGSDEAPEDLEEATLEVAAKGEPLLLSRFLEAVLGPRLRPLVIDATHLRGFLHRLDVPSSGLILVAKSYEAFWDLQLQLVSGTVLREYVALCHGWASPEQFRAVQAGVLWQRRRPGPSKVSRHGKPSHTNFKVLAHGLRKREAYSLVAISIVTGRRHQIRVHSAHAGHPTACDGKYTAPSTFDSDRSWCARNFLHRCRLAFNDSAGKQQQALAVMPRDLKSALRQVEGRDEASRAAMQLWLAEAPRGW
ncbi:unnamed protein product, partial [Polarella glacialis]